MEASKIIANRAYRIIRELPVDSPCKPSVGDVVFCFEAGGNLSLAFCHPDATGAIKDFKIKLPRRDADGVMVFAKLLTLPPSLRQRYNIREDGTRISFRKDQVYLLANAVDGSAPAGTLFRCLKGGADPMMVHWPEGGAQPVACNTTGAERQQLFPAEPALVDSTHDEFNMTTAGTSVEWNWMSWRVRIDNDVLSWRGHQLSLSRPAGGDIRVNELESGSLAAIAGELRAHLKDHGIDLQASNAELVELYANHEFHFKGLRPFARTVELIKQYVDDDKQKASASAAGRRAAATRPLGGYGTKTTKRMSGAAYKNMMKSNARAMMSYR